MNKRLAIKQIHSECPNINMKWNSEYQEYRVAYKMLSKSGTIEASAYYTNDLEDAMSTARVMQKAITQ